MLSTSEHRGCPERARQGTGSDGHPGSGGGIHRSFRRNPGSGRVPDRRLPALRAHPDEEYVPMSEVDEKVKEKLTARKKPNRRDGAARSRRRSPHREEGAREEGAREEGAREEVLAREDGAAEEAREKEAGREESPEKAGPAPLIPLAWDGSSGRHSETSDRRSHDARRHPPRTACPHIRRIPPLRSSWLSSRCSPGLRARGHPVSVLPPSRTYGRPWTRSCRGDRPGP